ncbi:MAG: hypothetical protein NC037_04760 [Bacteroides sp.]|nr:hypothetical protein [Bacillota bacterium]MCM1394209.1 hypothetical protein [[Eubacterium] siraeum]MCM1455821.1 hypothetical protein [Bacteroides sp.]
MKTERKFGFFLIAILFALIATSLLLCAVDYAYAETSGYYVCFSNQNYAVRNANLMQEYDGEYYLKNVELSANTDFYITNGTGLRWYAQNDKPLSVSDAAVLKYDIKFSPDNVYSEESDFAKTDCNFTYRFHVPTAFSVNIGGEEYNLNYNPHNTRYDLYYISSVYIEADDSIVCEGETKSVAADGYYRILYTPEKTVNGNVYKFDSNGNYGSGDGFDSSLYIEDAPQYFVVFKDGLYSGVADAQIGDDDAYILTRYEENIAAKEYRSPKFFLSERGMDVKYTIYEKLPNGSYDSKSDAAFGRLTATDAGSHTLSFFDGNAYLTALNEEETPFGDWYISGEFNDYCFDANGLPDLDSDYRFEQIEEGDADYNENYAQYRVYFTVTESALKDGDLEFFITDGKTKYKNGVKYIALNTAGRYKIIFSDEHNYGRLLNYKYVLEDENVDSREITIETADEFFEFASACSASADYSVNLKVYLKADLDFAGLNFTPIQSFSGTFYGGYHTLKNITVNASDASDNVFTVLNRTAVVERLFVKNMNLGTDDTDYVGFVGRNYGTIKYVETDGTVAGKNYVGGVVAYNAKSAADDNAATTESGRTAIKAVLENCASRATVSGRVHVGGIAGYNSGDISTCTSFGNVTAKRTSSSATVFNVGGIAGYSSGRISDCVSQSDVIGGSDSLYIGGVVGLCTGEIYFSENKGEVSASRYGGGIAGYYGTIGNSDDRNDFFDGISLEDLISGYFPADEEFEQGSGDANIINYCVNSGNVTALSYAGGIVGNASANGLKIYNCASVADVSATAGSYVGGIAANCDNADIISCISSGIISAKGLNGGNYVGGIVGYGGNVSHSMSSATLKGKDYVGGIAGYGVGKAVSNYANVLLSVDGNINYSGAIMGFSEAYIQSINSFEGNVKANYYVGSSGGISNRNYASEFDYAAAYIDSQLLATDGALSAHLCADFDRDFWQGGDGELSYPTARNFEEVSACADFGDDEKWQSLFLKHAQDLKNITVGAARLTYTVTVMEWHTGDLYDDAGNINGDNFEIIAVLRAYKGENIKLPELVHTTVKNGVSVYEADDAVYFAYLPSYVVADGNISVYAQYTEAVTSLSDKDGKVFIEGFFKKGTEVELTEISGLYSIKLIFDGQEIAYEDAIVKFYVGGGADGYKVFVADGQTEKQATSKASGKYVSFNLSNGEYFRAELADDELPFWAWLLIGIVIAVAAAGIAVLVVFIVKKQKSKKAHSKESSDKVHGAESADKD